MEASARLSAIAPQADIQGALTAGELVLHYQPIVALADGQIHGVEALLRWQHPTGGLLHPDDFLPAIAHTPAMLAVAR
jgi:Amt family ammonium transporter